MIKTWLCQEALPKLKLTGGLDNMLLKYDINKSTELSQFEIPSGLQSGNLFWVWVKAWGTLALKNELTSFRAKTCRELSGLS